MSLDERELHIRKAWHLWGRRYGDGNQSAWVSDPHWPKWRDIGYLLMRLSMMNKLLREAEAAADDRHETEVFSAVPRPRPLTSEDTIPVQWSKDIQDLKDTPDTALHALPAVPLPVAPKLPPPPATPPRTLTEVELWNATLAAVTIAIDTTLSQCLRQGTNLYDVQVKLQNVLKGLRKNPPIPTPQMDEGYTL